ncbi:MAG: hypothetical protein QNJ73_10335 [Gammaproteobacteria bacterium]|nr:hypothetical protein [Gammaproteobacteria bacterium]
MSNQNLLSLLCALSLFWLPGAMAHDSDKEKQEAACERLDERIRKLESKRRGGYTASQGRRWKDQLRELELQRFRECR